jgi:hypothetical protein
MQTPMSGGGSTHPSVSGIQGSENGVSGVGKQQVMMKLRSQNEKLKGELKTLSSKLEDYLAKSKEQRIIQLQN